jgi:hypothetical protein
MTLSRVLGVILGVTMFFPSVTIASNSKTLALDGIRAWREKVIEQDRRAEVAQASALNQAAKASLKREMNKSQVSEYSNKEFEASLDRIQELDDERLELKAQRQILDQLISRVASKWSGSNLKGFLEISLLEMSQNDLADPGQGSVWRFLVQASFALREIAEPSADPIRFLQTFTTESSVLTPKSMADILRTQNYVGN